MTARLQPRYKFTYPGREAPFGVTDYPTGGRWSEKRTPVLCYSGWHIPADGKLSYWIKPELWEVRVKGQHVHDYQKEAWEQIRFVRRIKAWNKDGMIAFIKFCRPDNWQSYAAASDAAAAAAAADAYAYAAASDAYAYAYAAASDAYAYAAASDDAAAAAAAAAAADAAAASDAAAAAAAAVRLSQSNWIIANIINANGGTSNGS